MGVVWGGMVEHMRRCVSGCGVGRDGGGVSGCGNCN